MEVSSPNLEALCELVYEEIYKLNPHLKDHCGELQINLMKKQRNPIKNNLDVHSSIDNCISVKVKAVKTPLATLSTNKQSLKQVKRVEPVSVPSMKNTTTNTSSRRPGKPRPKSASLSRADLAIKRAIDTYGGLDATPRGKSVNSVIVSRKKVKAHRPSKKTVPELSPPGKTRTLTTHKTHHMDITDKENVHSIDNISNQAVKGPKLKNTLDHELVKKEMAILAPIVANQNSTANIFSSKPALSSPIEKQKQQTSKSPSADNDKMLKLIPLSPAAIRDWQAISLLKPIKCDL